MAGYTHLHLHVAVAIAGLSRHRRTTLTSRSGYAKPNRICWHIGAPVHRSRRTPPRRSKTQDHVDVDNLPQTWRIPDSSFSSVTHISARRISAPLSRGRTQRLMRIKPRRQNRRGRRFVAANQRLIPIKAAARNCATGLIP